RHDRVPTWTERRLKRLPPTYVLPSRTPLPHARPAFFGSILQARDLPRQGVPRAEYPRRTRIWSRICPRPGQIVPKHGAGFRGGFTRNQPLGTSSSARRGGSISRRREAPAGHGLSVHWPFLVHAGRLEARCPRSFQPTEAAPGRTAGPP